MNHFFCDLRNSAEVERAAASVRAHLAQTVPKGGILLINNSGFGSFGAFAELNLGSQLEMIDVNVRALVHLTGLLLPDLLARGGVVLNIASTVAFLPTPYAATYGATKAFVLNWTVALNEELRGTRVRALAVSPGTTATPFFATAGIGSKATASALTLSPDDVARAALQALATGRAQVVTGWGNKVYTWIGARLPKAWAARLAARVMRQRRKQNPAA